MLPMFLALYVAAQATWAPAGEHEFREARVVRYNPMPTVGSGMLMVLRGVEIATRDGRTLKIFFIHMGGGADRYPEAGSVCDFTTVTHRIANEAFGDGGPAGRLAELVRSADCPAEAVAPS
jgi:hypothetical protein